MQPQHIQTLLGRENLGDADRRSRPVKQHWYETEVMTGVERPATTWVLGALILESGLHSPGAV